MEAFGCVKAGDKGGYIERMSNLSHPEDRGEYDFDKVYCNVTNGIGITDDYSDPEEAIVALIEYLVENNLIK